MVLGLRKLAKLTCGKSFNISFSATERQLVCDDQHEANM